MGWTFTHRPKGQSTREFFQEEFGDGVIDAAATLTEAYIAYRVSDRESGEAKGVICVVCLVRWVRDDYFNFGYKELEESSGPGPARCPERILQLLTKFDFGSDEANRRSREWRERCWARVRKRKSRPSLECGMVIRFREPIPYSDGSRISEFIVASTKPLRFVDARYPVGSYRYTIRRETLVATEFEVVGQAVREGRRWKVTRRGEGLVGADQ